MRTDREQTEQLEKIEQRSRRLKAAVDEWMGLIDEARKPTPEDPRFEFVTTVRTSPNGSKRTH